MKIPALLARVEAAPWRFAAFCYLLVAIARVVAVQLVPISYVTDEATWMAASRWFWLTGTARTHAGRLPFLYPALLSPVLGLLDFERAYVLAKVVNALLATAALFPIWRLARRFARDGIAVAVSVLSVIGIPASYAAVVMADSLFFFLFWLLLASFVSLVRQPGLREAIAFGLAGSALAATKPQALPGLGILVFALCVWLFWSRRKSSEPTSPFPWRIFTVAFGTLIAGLIAVAGINGGTLVSEFYASNERVYGLDAGALLDNAAGLIALLSIGSGVLPFAGLIVLMRRGSLKGVKREGAFLLTVAGGLLVGYLVFASAFGVLVLRDRLPERQVVFLYPAVLVLAVALTYEKGRRSPPAAAAIAGLAAMLFLSYGLSRYPAPDVLEVAEAPTRAAFPRLAGSGGAGLAAAAGGVAVVIGSLLGGTAPRLAMTGVLTALLGIGVSIAQIRWSATWGLERYQQLRVESVLIPADAPVVLLPEGMPDDIRLFETARRVERLQTVAAAYLAVDGPSGEVRVPPSMPTEEYWIATPRTLLRNELLYSNAGHRVYRVRSSPRILARLTERPGALEIEYYPVDPFLDEVVFVAEAESDRMELSGEKLEAAAGGATSAIEMVASRGEDHAFRSVLRIRGCGNASLLSPVCPALKRLFVLRPDERVVMDDLYP